MRPDEIDFSNSPETTPEEFARAIVRRGGLQAKQTKVPLTLRVDAEVLDWFRSRGRGYQTEISALLRAYMDEHRKRAG